MCIRDRLQPSSLPVNIQGVFMNLVGYNHHFASVRIYLFPEWHLPIQLDQGSDIRWSHFKVSYFASCWPIFFLICFTLFKVILSMLSIYCPWIYYIENWTEIISLLHSSCYREFDRLSLPKELTSATEITERNEDLF